MTTKKIARKAPIKGASKSTGKRVPKKQTPAQQLAPAVRKLSKTIRQLDAQTKLYNKSVGIAKRAKNPDVIKFYNAQAKAARKDIRQGVKTVETTFKLAKTVGKLFKGKSKKQQPKSLKTFNKQTNKTAVTKAKNIVQATTPVVKRIPKKKVAAKKAPVKAAKKAAHVKAAKPAKKSVPKKAAKKAVKKAPKKAAKKAKKPARKTFWNDSPEFQRLATQDAEPEIDGTELLGKDEKFVYKYSDNLGYEPLANVREARAKLEEYVSQGKQARYMQFGIWKRPPAKESISAYYQKWRMKQQVERTKERMEKKVLRERVTELEKQLKFERERNKEK